MNEIFIELKQLAVGLSQGDYDVLNTTSNSAWIALGAFVCVLLLVVRILTRPRAAAEPQPMSPEELDIALRAPGQRGVFGPLTDALAAQLPEREKERSEFSKLLRQA